MTRDGEAKMCQKDGGDRFGSPVGLAANERVVRIGRWSESAERLLESERLPSLKYLSKVPSSLQASDLNGFTVR